jgi:hypothetical protein
MDFVARTYNGSVRESTLTASFDPSHKYIAAGSAFTLSLSKGPARNSNLP